MGQKPVELAGDAAKADGPAKFRSNKLDDKPEEGFSRAGMATRKEEEKKIEQPAASTGGRPTFNKGGAPANKETGTRPTFSRGGATGGAAAGGVTGGATGGATVGANVSATASTNSFQRNVGGGAAATTTDNKKPATTASDKPKPAGAGGDSGWNFSNSSRAKK